LVCSVMSQFQAVDCFHGTWSEGLAYWGHCVLYMQYFHWICVGAVLAACDVEACRNCTAALAWM
jgi:hypothetical protein